MADPSPALHEVAMLIQFDRLKAITNVDLLKLWTDTKLRSHYPIAREYSELPPFLEVFGETQKRLKSEIAPPVFRYNFRSEERQEQFQVQRDRAAFYWQSGSPLQPYPRLEHVSNKFFRDFDIFTKFIDTNELGSISPNQCALSYRNKIPRGDLWQKPQEFSHLVTFCENTRYSIEPLDSVELEEVAAMQVYIVKNDMGQPAARMFVTIGKSEEEYPTAEIEFVVRGAPASPNRDGIEAFFALARRHANAMFESVCTRELQQAIK